MRLRHIMLGIAGVLALLALGGAAWSWRSAIAPISADQRANIDRQAAANGAELSAIGNCSTCHTTDSGKSYAGGRPIPTPFGTIFASNVTPDADTGIGTWSEAAFRRAMRDGVDREGRQLYPAFPYDHFTNATDDDIHALYGFLMTQTPYRNHIPANELAFPFNFRPLVTGWKLLFFRDARLRNDASKSAEWHRGRYLVEGLGHCGSCHTPRNALGAEKSHSAFAGGVAEGWNAPALTASLVAHKWTAAQLTEYLSTGWHKLHGAAAGPMADVANNLSQASMQDVRAIATYIASLSDGGVTAPAQYDNPATGAPDEVVAIYTGACANCHNEPGAVGPSKALPLPLSSSVQQSGSANTIRVILYGIQSYRGNGGPYMPAFDGIITDKQLAALAQYVRARYSSQPLWTDVQEQIKKARKEGS
jgi:mono/diheme cytochrome c family protein